MEKMNSHAFLKRKLRPKATELADYGKERKAKSLLHSWHLFLWSPDLLTHYHISPAWISLLGAKGGDRGGGGPRAKEDKPVFQMAASTVGEDRAGPEMGCGLKMCFLCLPFHSNLLGLMCKGFS